MKKNILITLLGALALLSCGQGKEKTQTVRVKQLYTIEIPDFLSEAKYLDKEASLQYQNLVKEVYIVVLDEPKEVLEKTIADNGLEDYYTLDINGYASLLTDSMEESVAFDSIPVLQPEKINGLNSQILNFTGKIEGVHIYWKLAYIEGRNNYYQVMTWTLASRKEEYQNIMDAMVNSFKEIDKHKK
ncbi:hypothetical protein E0W68_02790 [Flavobacterium salilacus subsp. salilacus]|uniref:hypothetical protein n=1 Tax=Flavobacterium TaxID=237 RepID=UPI001074B243|nr:MULTISPECIES: hypothetical protein [Flavobacterium]KAF2520167.1 hypothetical protein E0W68_02790 [Flavobacterium salilacus subsp. salilacus]MBE1613917.1 hypothetical protein [Flavobacterium sp. SaA2.13]